jgi:hypothetical protein
MNERPTPETDANVGEWDEGKFWEHPKGRIVEADFARKLERERDEARESKDRISQRAEAIRYELVESERKLAEANAYAARCRDGCISLSYSIDRIDYLYGEPNEMGVSDYCVHQNDEAVVERVKAKLVELEAMREAIREAATAIDRLTTAAAGGMQPANAKLDAIRSGNAALAKLQPFTTI